jgi:hypothetical protein
MAKVTWLGDEDASIKIITHGGVEFEKGVAIDVDDAEYFADNHFFLIEGADSADSADELETVKAELRAKGITFGPNSKLESLKAKLAEAA